MFQITKMKSTFTFILAGMSLALASMTAISPNSHASGFAVGEQGAKATGVAAAFAARADDPSAQFYNPAGMTDLKQGTHVMIGSNIITPNFEWENGSESGKSEFKIFPIPYLYAQYHLNKDFVVGFAEFSAFGLGNYWEDGWKGSSKVQHIDLKTITLNPNIAYRVAPGLSLAVGLDITRGIVELDRDIQFGDPGGPGSMFLAGDAWGVGYNAAVRYTGLPKWTFGLSFRSGGDLDFEGDVDFKNVPQEWLNKFADQEISATITLPHVLMAGVGYQVDPKLYVELNVQWTGWSSYDELCINFKDRVAGGLTPGESCEARDWEDSLSYKLGSTYALNPEWELRAGYMYEEAPNSPATLDPSLPDSYRHMITLGAGYEFNNFFLSRVDFAYLHVFLTERETSTDNAFPGTYNSSIDGLSISTTMQF